MKTYGKLSWLAAGAMLFAASEAAAQTEILWWHAMTGANNNVDRETRRRVQCQPEGLQGRPELPRQLSRHPERRHRRVPRRAGSAHHAGVRGRHRHHDVSHRRRQTGARADEGSGRVVRSQELSPHHHRLLLDDQGRDALVPVQFVEHRDVVQQGQLQEGRARPREGAEDLARGVRGRQEAEGLRPPQLRLRQCLGDLGQSRAAVRLAQRAARLQGQRHGRLRHRAEIQQPAAREAPAEPGGAAEGQDLRLLRAAPIPAKAGSPPANARSS